MSLEAAIYDILKSAAGVTDLVGGAASPRIYPLTIPQGKPMPVVVYQQIGSGVEFTCEGSGDLRTDSVQISVWDDDPDGARLLAEAVRTAMLAAAARGSHGGVTIQYCSIEEEGDAISIPDDNETLARCGKRQDWEVAYA